VDEVELDRIQRGRLGSSDHFSQKQAKKGVTQPVITGGIEQERKEVRVSQFLSDDTHRLEDVELRNGRFELFEFRVIQNELLKSFGIGVEFHGCPALYI